MIIGIDLDGVIAEQSGGWTPEYYQKCTPDLNAIRIIKMLHERGDKIIIYTSRLATEAKVDTIKWLHRHQVVFDAIHFDKPLYDVMIDDKSISLEELQQLCNREGK